MTDASVAPAPSRTFGAGAALLCFLAYLGGQFVLAGAVGFVVALVHLAGGGDRDALLGAVLAPAVLSGMAGGAVGAWLVARAFLGGPVGRLGREAFGLRPAGGRVTLLSAAAGIALALGLGHLAPLLVPPPADDSSTIAQIWSSGSFGRFTVAVVALALAPAFEELVFRGALYHGFRRLGRGAAGLLVVVLFVLPHLPDTIQWWPGVVMIALLGGLTVWLREATGSVVPAIAAHTGYNGVAIAVTALS